MLGKKAGGEGTEDEMVGWHYRFNGHEFEQTPGDSEGQGNLACCHPWDAKVGHDLATEQQQCLQKHCLRNLKILYVSLKLPVVRGHSFYNHIC